MIGCARRLEIISHNPSFYKWEKMSPTLLIHRANQCRCLFISRFCALSKGSPECEASHLAFDGSNYSKQSEQWCCGAAFNANSNFQILLELISFPVLQGNLELNEAFSAGLHTQCLWTTPASQHGQKQQQNPKQNCHAAKTFRQGKENKYILGSKTFFTKEAHLATGRSKHCLS